MRFVASPSWSAEQLKSPEAAIPGGFLSLLESRAAEDVSGLSWLLCPEARPLYPFLQAVLPHTGSPEGNRPKGTSPGLAPGDRGWSLFLHADVVEGVVVCFKQKASTHAHIPDIF